MPQYRDEIEAVEDDHPCRYFAGPVSCQLCGCQWTAVWCACVLGLECPACGHMAGMPSVEE